MRLPRQKAQQSIMKTGADMGITASQPSCIAEIFLWTTKLSSGLWRKLVWFAVSERRNIVLKKGKPGKLRQICWIGTFMQTSRAASGSRMWRNSACSERNSIYRPFLICTAAIWSAIRFQTILCWAWWRPFEKIPDGTNLILHSDEGWQYQHKQYQRMLRTKGIRRVWVGKATVRTMLWSKTFSGCSKVNCCICKSSIP